MSIDYFTVLATYLKKIYQPGVIRYQNESNDR